MSKNRKKTSRYRFNGHPGFQTGSIHAVDMAELEARIRCFEAKLADPNDPDDKRWTARWLDRFRRELDKKRAGQALKQRDKRACHRT